MTTFLVPKNNAYSTLASGIDDNDLALTVATGEGARFPTTFPFHITIDSEILSCTDRTADVLTVTRGAESTTPAAHLTAATVRLNITAEAISELGTAINLRLLISEIDDSPADGVTTAPISSNWAYDHAALATAHGLVAATDPGGATLLHIIASVNGATAWSVVDIFDVTVAETQAIGDSAAAGTATTAAHRDHKHAMPSAATMNTASVAAVAAAGVVFATAKSVEFEAVPATHTADGIIVTMTAGTALVFSDACYVGTDGKMEKALADDAAITVPATHMAIATISENAEGLFLVHGWASDASWSFDVGKNIYLSAATAGLITKTMPTKVTGNQVQVLGTCLVADTIYWNPDLMVIEYA